MYAVPCTVMELVSGAPLLGLVVENVYSPGILSVTVSVCLTVAFTPLSSVGSPLAVAVLGSVQKVVEGGPPVVMLIRVNSSGSSLISENVGS